MSLQEQDDRFEAELNAAIASSDADGQLAAMLSSGRLRVWYRVEAAAALGDSAPGSAGTTALRSTYHSAKQEYSRAAGAAKSDCRDLMCAIITALAKRDGSTATDVYADAISSGSEAIRDYGMNALAAFGDDRAWNQVVDRLAALLGRRITPSGMRWREARQAIEYLARHSPYGSTRSAELVGLLRGSWRNLGDPDLIRRWWPGIEPGAADPGKIDLAAMHTPKPWWQEEQPGLSRRR